MPADSKNHNKIGELPPTLFYSDDPSAYARSNLGRVGRELYRLTTCQGRWTRVEFAESGD